MISFLLSCVVVGRVAERARGQARQAEQRRETSSAFTRSRRK